MLERESVFLSPHRDDICFSIGLLAWFLGGTIISLFTRSQYTASTTADLSADTVERVSNLRRDEDLRFMSLCNLSEVDLGWSEAPLRGYNPFDVSALQAELATFESELIDALKSFGSPEGRYKPWLFCPSGIGGHRDHLIVRNSIANHIPELEQAFVLAFYEDLPYAYHMERYNAGIGDFLSLFVSNQVHRTAIRFDDLLGLKLRMLHCYASQFDKLPEDLAHFTPAASGSVVCEAIWTRPSVVSRLHAFASRIS